MSICLSKKTWRILSVLWLKRSHLRKRYYAASFAAVREFLEWCDRHDIWLMTHHDGLESGETEVEIKKIRKWKREG